MQRPRIKPHVALVPVSPDNVLVKGPALFVRYGGEAVPPLLALAARLDGTRTLEQAATEAGVDLADARDLLDALVADRVVEDAALDDDIPLDADERTRLDAQILLLSHLTSQPARALRRILDARVMLLGTGALADALAQNLLACGLRHLQRADAADLPLAGAATARERVRDATHVVAAFDQPAPAVMLAINEACLAEDVPLTTATLEGLDATLGPTVLPRQTACWRCYDLRVKGAHPNLERLLAYEASAHTPPRPVGLPTFAHLAGAQAAQAVVLSLSGAVLPPLAGHVLRMELLTGRAQRHRVLRIPRCPACSRADIPDVDRYVLDPVRLP